MDTILNLRRKWFTDKSTIGELYFGLDKFCYSLEDSVRFKKIQNVTAIPSGRYEVVITFSNRFLNLMPLLLNVPGFDGIRIHSGNTDADTDGCILVGKTRFDDQPDVIFESRAAFSDLMEKLTEAIKQGKVFIEITGSRNMGDVNVSVVA
jgi:adenylate kinase family enzyme